MRRGLSLPAAWSHRLRSLGLALLAWMGLAGADPQVAPPPAPAARAEAPAAGPIRLDRFAKPGPLAGVVARIDLRDPRVSVKVVMADGSGTEGGKDCAGRLEVPSALARRHDLAVAINASFFRAKAKTSDGQAVTYFVGNCASPVGWHYSEGRLQARPAEARLRAAAVLHTSGRMTLHASLEQLPTEVRYAVGGNAMVLDAGKVIARASDTVRHPRSAVGLSEDGNTLLLVAVDGRAEGHSQGATLAELGELLKGFGARDAINLDGGGSTALVVKDSLTGVFTVANRPSGVAANLPGTPAERPVVDVLGVVLRELPTERRREDSLRH